MQLVHPSNLIRSEAGLALQRGLMDFSATHPEKHPVLQNLQWLERDAWASPSTPQLTSDQAQILDEAVPGGAGKYLSYVQEQQLRGAAYRLLDSKLNKLAANQGYQPLPAFSASGYTDLQVEQVLLQLVHRPVEGVSQPGSEYSMIAPGIAAKAVYSGAYQVNLELLNSTCQPYDFDGSDYIGQSTRVSQRMALGGPINAPTPAQAAQNVMQALGQSDVELVQASFGQVLRLPAQTAAGEAAAMETAALARAIVAAGEVLFAAAVGLGAPVIFGSLAVGAAIGTIIWSIQNKTATSSNSATGTCPPQTCTDDVKAALMAEQDRLCDQQGSMRCSAPPFKGKRFDATAKAAYCASLLRNQNRFKACIAARLKVMDECFGGGDDVHHKAVAQRDAGLNNCLELYATYCSDFTPQ